MNSPPGSNGFYLPGEFEGPAPVASNGWVERLARHFEQMSSSEQAIFPENGGGAHEYAFHAIGKFCMRQDPVCAGHERRETAILEHEKPLFYRSTGNFDRMASLATFWGPVLTVDEALKSFIEWLEPGVHTFVPIEVRRARDKPPIGTRHILVVGQRIDSFSEAQSHKDSFRISPDSLHIGHEEVASSMRRLAFQKEKIGGAHLWLEARFRSYLLCLSDRLHAEIVDAGLRVPRHLQMREV